jgi:hypothetical protein
MPIPLENSPLTPNLVYCPQLILQTGIVDGQLLTSAVLTLAAAHADAAGSLTPTGQTEMVHLENVIALEADLAHLQPAMTLLYGQIVALIGELNKARKLL